MKENKMDPILEGMKGVAVEDIQDRLTHLHYEIDKKERDSKYFGPSTANAIVKFRVEHNLPVGQEVDKDTWITLVDECYEMGDRTLYLRLPNFHGNDVRELQNALNILGFSCGEAGGYYDAHTEAAVKSFQESVGQLADGMAFPETFDAIERLHHVWAGKPAAGPHPMGAIGYARAANVLESVHIAITGDDPISRNVAGRIFNLASATANDSGLELVDDPDHVSKDCQAIFMISSKPLPENSTNVPNIVLDDIDTLGRRIHTALASSVEKQPLLRVELPVGDHYNGTFTTSDAQTLAVFLLDAICSAFAQNG
ncbi:peptidoglycan-binding protein [Atopobium sp. oral taxon 416]|uniref:peptidoglycan-binding domain-containing protein n=1 Tax=Atopobium sp. oral taxon 416 TaxID=712157 RepID=UPI0035304FDD